MANSKIKKHISKLYMNGLHGRMLRIEAPKNKNREILVVYGHHATLERMFGLVEVLSKHGAVTMPDLPGFGGMESFYKIGKEPTIDNYADYLAAFVKLRYKRRRFTVVGMSFSVLIVVRMLQKYPELAKKVDLVISISGFVHKDAFVLNPWAIRGLKILSRTFSYRTTAFLMRHLILTKPIIKATYLLVAERHSKLNDTIDAAERQKRIEFEVGLWQVNDVRTRMYTMLEMFKADLCNKSINLPIYHVTAKSDRYFDNKVVEEHLKIIFSQVEIFASRMANHAPTIIATAKEAMPYVPRRLRSLLG